MPFLMGSFLRSSSIAKAMDLLTSSRSGVCLQREDLFPRMTRKKLLEQRITEAESAYANLETRQYELRATSRKPFDNEAQRKEAIDNAHWAVKEAASACQKADAPLKNLLHLCSSTAVSLSGGGIRSASFSLGVLQGLARFSFLNSGEGFLHQIDYLSTVSGGGYVGSWLMGWACRSSFKSSVYELSQAGKA